ncbi:hypothetical protein J4526_08470 [Desulfurococcaceae archaeon MEX13E-LK6-19]|nr:hypothetical protein J4526_08470 [Desulfurococcaceae archaeon MEX13E-LK6-19]
MDLIKTMRILWLLLLFLMTLIYVIYGLWLLVMATLIGVIIWFLVNKIILSEKVFGKIFKATQMFFKGEHFLLATKVSREMSLKELLFTEGINRSFLPILFMFGLINYTLRYLDIQGFEEVLESPVILLLGFSTVITSIIPFLWVVIDSKWFFQNKKTGNVMNVGEQLLTYLRGVAGATVVLSLISTSLERMGAYETFIFLFLSLTMGGIPIFFTTLIYIKYFHQKFVEKLRSMLKNELSELEIILQPQN